MPDTSLHTAYSISLTNTEILITSDKLSPVRALVQVSRMMQECPVSGVHQRTVITSRLWSQDSGNTQEM